MFQTLLLILSVILYTLCLYYMLQVIFVYRKLDKYFFFSLTTLFGGTFILLQMLLSTSTDPARILALHQLRVLSTNLTLCAYYYCICLILWEKVLTAHLFLIISLVFCAFLPHPLFLHLPVHELVIGPASAGFIYRFATKGIIYSVWSLWITSFFVFNIIKVFSSRLTLEKRLFGMFILMPVLAAINDLAVIHGFIRFIMIAEYFAFFFIIGTFIIFFYEKIRDYRHIQRVNEQLEVVVAERTSQLEATMKEKNRFYLTLAHETRMPLTLVRNYLDLYIKDHPDDDRLNIIRSSIEYLYSHMLDLLDMEKLQRGLYKTNTSEVISISQLAENLENLIKPKIAEKKIDLSLDIEPDIIVNIGKLDLERILYNLLDNALRYTPENEIIWLRVFRKQQSAVVEVEDKGPGVSNKLKLKIFEENVSSNLNSGDLGMGLYMVSNLVSLYGGTIELVSDEGHGACFRVILPLSEVGISDNKSETIFYTQDISLPNSISWEKILEEERIDSQDIDKPLLLIVDDSLPVLSLLATGLKKYFSLCFARDGLEALKRLENMSVLPSLILTDIIMQDMDGLTLLQRIKNSPEHSHIPLVFLSASSTIQQKISALNMGAIDYIYKPFDIEELISRINALLRQKELLSEFIRNEMTEKISQALEKKQPMKSMIDKNVLAERFAKKYNLSDREKEVLKLLSEGLFNKEIAYQLGITKKTIDFHISNIYRKTGVQCRLELINILSCTQQPIH